MLEIEVGAPGAGKTYNALANRIIPAAVAGRMVITNVPVIVERLEAFKVGAAHCVEVHDTRDGWAWWTEALCSSADHPAFQWRHPDYPGMGPLVVLDEVREIIHAKEKSLPDGMESFFSRHRHAGLDVVLVTQNLTDVYMPVRKLASSVWTIKNLGVIGLKGRYVRTCFDSWTCKTKVGGSKWGKYDSDIWLCYESFTGGGGAYDRKQKVAWKSPKSLFLAGAGIAAAVYMMGHPVKKPGVVGAPVNGPVATVDVAGADRDLSPVGDQSRSAGGKADDFEKLLSPSQRADLARVRYLNEKRRLHIEGQEIDLAEARMDQAERQISELDVVDRKAHSGLMREDGGDPALMKDPRLKLVGWMVVGDRPSFWIAVREGDLKESRWTQKRFEDAGYIVQFLRTDGRYSGVKISGKGHEWSLDAD